MIKFADGSGLFHPPILPLKGGPGASMSQEDDYGREISDVTEEERAAHRLQLVLSDEGLRRLRDLMVVMEAASYNEVVRRALQAYEDVLRDFGGVDSGEIGQTGERRLYPREPSRRIQVLLPDKSMQRLKSLKKQTNATSYAEVIRQALGVLATLWRIRGQPSDGPQGSMPDRTRILAMSC